MMVIKVSMRDVDAVVPRDFRGFRGFRGFRDYTTTRLHDYTTTRLHDYTTTRHSARVRWLARSDSLRIWVLDRDAEGWDGRGVVSDH